MGGNEAQSLWSELGTTMRRVRGAAGVSLRELETRGNWRRSTISQVENGKARPSLQLVEWYDSELGSDGLLVSIYAQARSHGLIALPRHQGGEDVVTVIDIDPPAGLLVNRGARLQACISLSNGGRTQWRGRRLRRLGAHSGLRLIESAPHVPVPDLAPGEATDVVVDLRAPERAGSTIAYWGLVDADGHERAGSSMPIAVLLVVT